MDGDYCKPNLETSLVLVVVAKTDRIALGPRIFPFLMFLELTVSHSGPLFRTLIFKAVKAEVLLFIFLKAAALYMPL